MLNKIMTHTIKNGGGTFDRQGTPAMFTEGYQVSIKDICTLHDVNNANLIDFEAILDRLGEDQYLRTWIDQNKLYIDISVHVDDIVEWLEEMGVEAFAPEDDEYVTGLYARNKEIIDVYFIHKALVDRRIDLRDEVEDTVEDRKEEVLNELADSICWDGMEMAIYSDWSSAIREESHTGPDEDMVVKKIGLSEYLWSDILGDWGIEDWEAADDEVKENFKEAVLLPMIEEV